MPETTSNAYREFIQLYKELERLYHQAGVALGLPDSVLSILFTLCEEGGGRTPTELYAEWAMSKQTGHSALLWLKKRGLVCLTPAEEDRRSKRVELTGEGETFVSRTVLPMLKAEKAAFRRLTEEEQRALAALDGKILHYLREEMAGQGVPAQNSI